MMAITLRKQLLIGRVKRLKEDGASNEDIAHRLKLTEEELESYLKIIEKANANKEVM